MKIVAALLCLLTWWNSAAAGAFDPGYAGFAVHVQGVENPYEVLGIFVLPHDTVKLSGHGPLRIHAGTGALSNPRKNQWQWRAPGKPGLYVLDIRDAADRAMRLNAFVMRPAHEVKDGYLDGYRIGDYPQNPFRGLASYRPPRGFVEVTPENRDVPVAPHFTLGQFLCKQESPWPKFLVLREALLVKLERILEAVNAAGFRTDRFAVMSGYRTPYYNKAIGNRMYSRHIYGGAADIYIDENPRDERMDDLNGDGRIDRRDASVLYDVVEALSSADIWNHLGGLGEYGRSSAHGPFIHVDARGYRARWGRR